MQACRALSSRPLRARPVDTGRAARRPARRPRTTRPADDVQATLLRVVTLSAHRVVREWSCSRLLAQVRSARPRAQALCRSSTAQPVQSREARSMARLELDGVEKKMYEDQLKGASWAANWRS